MRLFPIAAACMLVACASPQSTQSNNARRSMNLAPAVAAPSANRAKVAIIDERHQGMETIGKTSKELRRQLGGGSPDLAVVRASAAKIADLSRKANGWFPAGTGPETGKTGAKPEIWQAPKDFAAKLAAFQRAAQAFNVAAAKGDLNAIQGRYEDLGASCKACHEKYRAEMTH